MHLSLRLKSDILLSALCASHLTKLELDLRPGWDNVGFLRLWLKKKERRLCFRSAPLICGFIANSRQRALACWAPILGATSQGVALPKQQHLALFWRAWGSSACSVPQGEEGGSTTNAIEILKNWNVAMIAAEILITLVLEHLFPSTKCSMSL